MFPVMLGGSLVFGAGLLAAASYSGGTLVAIKTAAQIIGWLFVLATVAGAVGLRRDALGQLGAATVTLISGLAILYVSYFQWDEIPEPTAQAPVVVEAPIVGAPIVEAPIRHAVADALPLRPVVYDRIDLSPKIIPPEPASPKQIVAMAVPARAPAIADACASLTGLESLQCRRCGDKSGIAWIACQERARLEFCEGVQADAATCPSAIPSVNLNSPPG